MEKETKFTYEQLTKNESFPETPMKDNGLTSEMKMEIIEKNVKEIMLALGLDLTDDSLQDTPKRVAKMYVNEIFYGLDKNKFPKITTVENKFGSQMVTEANITLNSSCEHHLITIAGVAHISYLPGKRVIGLSKMNRIVEYFGARPQVQERCTEQIQKALSIIMDTEDVAVVLDGVHFCVRARGIKDKSSVTRTASLGGKFLNDPMVRAEFFANIPKLGDFKL